MPGNADKSIKARKSGDKRESSDGESRLVAPVGVKAVARTDEKPKSAENPKPAEEVKENPKADKTVEAKAKPEKTGEKKAKSAATEKEKPIKTVKDTPKADKATDKKTKPVKSDEKKTKSVKTDKAAPKSVKAGKDKPKADKTTDKKSMPVKATKPVGKIDNKVAEKSVGKADKPVGNVKKTVNKANDKAAKPVDKTVDKAAGKIGNKTVVKPVKTAGKAVKTEDKSVDEITFAKTVRNVRALVDETVSFIDGMYSANRALGGFGGGRNAVVSDLLGYVCGLITEIGRANGKAEQAARLCDAAVMKGARGAGGKKIPLCVKITVALDIHSGSKSTVRLCGFIGRILSRTAPLTDCTALQAKEPIDGLIAFAVGQGMKI